MSDINKNKVKTNLQLAEPKTKMLREREHNLFMNTLH